MSILLTMTERGTPPLPGSEGAFEGVARGVARGVAPAEAVATMDLFLSWSRWPRVLRRGRLLSRLL